MLVCQILCTFSHAILFINFAYTFVSTSIQRIIFPSRHTANMRLFWLILLNRYMSPSKVLPHPAESPGPFSRPCKKLHSQQARFTDQGKCHPMQSQTSPRHLPDASPTAVQPPRFAELPLDTGFKRSSFVMGINSPLIVLRHIRSISLYNSESCVDGLVLIHRAQIQSPLHPLVFRSFESSTFFQEDC